MHTIKFSLRCLVNAAILSLSARRSCPPRPLPVPLPRVDRLALGTARVPLPTLAKRPVVAVLLVLPRPR